MKSLPKLTPFAGSAFSLGRTRVLSATGIDASGHSQTLGAERLATRIWLGLTTRNSRRLSLSAWSTNTVPEKA
jgi:hypothetical protein